MGHFWGSLDFGGLALIVFRPMSNSSIHLLASEVVDQIAAGEVVDRPAHLVKELVENAIDAGATSVEVEFDQGGRRVRVTDNGSGIRPDELGLALARHATSKIDRADDLWNLSSFGFRGEALASIAAVSRLTLQSRTRETENAYRIFSEFGRVSAPEATGGNVGTTVLVEELFQNVPARLKFMKSETAESSQIKAALRALALANEGVEFRVRTKGKLEHVWPRAKSFLERASQIGIADKLYEAQGEFEGFRVHIVFAGPHDVSGSSRSITVFVQKRWVQDRGLQAAVTDSYRSLLMHGEFPIAIVRLEAPKDEVDVNIHPTKSQVKFRDNQTAFRSVHRVLREALEKAPWLESKPAPAKETEIRKLSVADLTRAYEANPTEAVLASTLEPSLATSPENSLGRFEAPEFNAVVFKQRHDLETTAEPLATGSEVSVQEALGPWSRLQVLGQANLTYILAQDSEKLVLIDQHAAHERVAYEKLMRAFKGGKIDLQTLLIPISIDLEGEGAELLESIAHELENLGVVIEQAGPRTIALRARPAIISDRAIAEALKTLAREIESRGGSFQIEKKISDICATMACHSVVRAGQALSIHQMRGLLEQMDEFPLSSFCPHGRPVSVEFSFSKIERDFGRIV